MGNGEQSRSRRHNLRRHAPKEAICRLPKIPREACTVGILAVGSRFNASDALTTGLSCSLGNRQNSFRYSTCIVFGFLRDMCRTATLLEVLGRDEITPLWD